MFSIHKLEEGEKILKKFDRKKLATMSTILEYKENALDLKGENKLKAGRYMLVPSTKHHGDKGKYYLSIYFSTGDGEEADSDGTFHSFKCKYVNSVNLDLDKYKDWNIIAEEEEA